MLHYMGNPSFLAKFYYIAKASVRKFNFKIFYSITPRIGIHNTSCDHDLN
jgi:hypothetical protein